jgi:hypothetical protein
MGHGDGLLVVLEPDLRAFIRSGQVMLCHGDVTNDHLHQ